MVQKSVYMTVTTPTGAGVQGTLRPASRFPRWRINCAFIERTEGSGTPGDGGANERAFVLRQEDGETSVTVHDVQ